MSETVRVFFESSKSFPPASKSLLTLQEVDASLSRLAQLTKEDEQQSELESIAKKWDRPFVRLYFLVWKNKNNLLLFPQMHLQRPQMHHSAGQTRPEDERRSQTRVSARSGRERVLRPAVPLPV